MEPGPVTVITGAASGIGRALALTLHRKGHVVISTDLNETGLDSLKAEIGLNSDRLFIAQLDVTQEAQWRELLATVISRQGRLDYLLNVAGYLKPGYTHEVDFSEIDRHLDVNVKGVMYGSKLAAELMVAQGNGHIINLASLAGLTPVQGLPLYAASKFAVRGFSLSLAQEMAPHGVHVTVVCPDAVLTPMLDLQVDYPEAAITFSGNRVLGPEEVAALIAGRVMKAKPWEVSLPWHRGLAAKLVGFAPGLARWVAGSFIRKGRKRQLKHR